MPVQKMCRAKVGFRLAVNASEFLDGEALRKRTSCYAANLKTKLPCPEAVSRPD